MPTFGSMPSVQPAAQAPVAPAAQPATPSVQQATPRPTSFNVFDFNKIKDDSEVEMFTRPVAKPVAQPAAQPVAQPAVETASIPSITETQVQRTIGAAMFADPTFNAKAPAEEEVLPQGTETSEFSALADEDDYNGRAGLETPAFTRQNATMMASAAVMSRPATRQEVDVDSLKERDVDYSLPAYLRMNSNVDNF